MPIDPGACRWNLPDPAAAPAGREILGVGGDLAPATMLAGYRNGLFAMPHRRSLVWWSPDPRGILPIGGFHASRSLRRSVRAFEVSVDQAFDEVLRACADPRRGGGHWISAQYAAGYRELAALGWAHTVEVWHGDMLAGGLLGVEVGGLFCGETMFHRYTGASKVAVWAIHGLLSEDGGPGRLFDVQWLTPHLATLGAVEVPRPEYLALLRGALQLPPRIAPLTRRPAHSVADGGARAG